MSDQSAVDIINGGLGQFDDGYVPVSAVLIVAAIDPETGREHLLFRRDSDCGAWKHLGMVETLSSDLRYLLTAEQGDPT